MISISHDLSYMRNMLLILLQFWFIFQSISATKQAVFLRKTGQFLADSEITRRHAESEVECSVYCTIHKRCVSVNYKVSGPDQGLCQLNNSTSSRKHTVIDDQFVSLGIPDWVRSFLFSSPV